MSTKEKRRRSRKKKSKQALVKDWSNIPLDVLGSIASRLLVAEETIFRATCKTWQSTPYRLLPSESDYSDPSCPWLFYFLRNKSKCRVFNPLRAKSFDLVFPSELAGYKIHCASDGWLLMDRQRFSLLLFNPLTRQIIHEIPELPITAAGFNKISFTFPSSQKCKIVGLSYDGMFGTLGIWKRGQREWECYELQEWETMFYKSDWGMISLGKKRFYCLAANGSVGMFNVKNPVQSWKIWDIRLQPNSPESDTTFYHPCYLVEGNGGAVLGIFETVNERRIEVYRLNQKRRLWEEIKHLGNQMLFLSNARCYSQPTRRKKLRNKIFFPRFAADHRNTYVFYCLTTKKFASFDGKFSSPSAHGLTDFQQSCWFTPATVLDVP